MERKWGVHDIHTKNNQEHIENTYNVLAEKEPKFIVVGNNKSIVQLGIRAIFGILTVGFSEYWINNKKSFIKAWLREEGFLYRLLLTRHNLCKIKY